MAGAQAGSTGGIGAQSPAVNPPSPMGQAGNQIAGQIGNMAGSAFGGMGGVQQTTPPQMPFNPNMMGGEGFTPGFGQQPFMAQAPQQLGGQPNPFAVQSEQQQMAGLGSLAAFLGGNPTPPTPTASPTQTPTAKPVPVATKPPPVATKPVVAKPSVVPPKTPPAVASAIQKLAAKQMGRR